MKNEPDVVKELREAERLGMLQSESRSFFERFTRMEDVAEDSRSVTIDSAGNRAENGDENRKRSFQEIKKKYHLMAEITSDLICTTTFEINPTYTYVNSSYERILGYAPEELIGKSVWDFVHPDDKRKLLRLLRTYLVMKAKKLLLGKETSVSERFESRMRDESGNWHYLESTANFIGNEVLLVSKDVTERKHAEERNAHLTSVIHAIRNVNQLINIVKDKDRLIQKVCDILVDGRGYEKSWVMLLDKNGGTPSVAIAGLSNETSPFFLEQVKQRNLPECVKELLSHNSRFLPLDQPGKRHTSCPLAKVHSNRGVFRCKLEYEDELYGVLGATVSSEVVSDKEEQDLFIEMCSDVAYALKNIENEKKRKHAEDQTERTKEYLQLQIDQMPIGLIVWDTKFRVTSWNPAAKNIFGFTTREVLGKHPYDFLVPKEGHAQIEKIWRCLQEGDATAHSSIINQTKDGRALLCKWLNVPLKEADGTVYGVLSMVQDITDAVRMQDELWEQREEFRTIFDSVPAFIFYKDTENRFVRVNKALTDVMGKSKELLEGKSCFDLYPREQAEAFWKEDKEVITSGKPKMNVIEPMATPKGTLWVQTNKVPYQDIHGNNVGIIGFALDVTSQKQAEKDLKESKEKYRKLFDSTPVFIAETDEEGNFLAVNQSMARSIGVPAEHLIGKNIFDIFPRDVAEKRAIIARKALQENKNQESEDERGGRYFANIFVPIINTDGKKTVQCVVREITEERKSREAIIQSEKKYHELADSLPQIVFETDEQGNFTFVNQASRKMTGYLQEDVKNLNAFQMIAPVDRERAKRNILKIMSGETISGIEYLLQRKDGTTFPGVIYSSPVTREKKAIGIRGIVVDVTSQKDQEEKVKNYQREVERQNIQLKKLDKIKSDFLNVTSHELRTPMSAIKGYSQMLLKQKLGQITDEQRQALDVVLRNTNRLDDLIRDILDVSRLESGTMKFMPQMTEIGKMVNETLETMQPIIALKNMKINVEIEHDMPNLSVDYERIKQVIINVINNAIKFSPNGSVINVRAKKENDDVLFEIQDFGRGISKDKQEKIFEVFYQVDSGMDRKFGGAGLGLAISRGIILSHGGKIWVESEGKPGKGSTFRFTLPKIPVKDIERKFREIDIFKLKEIQNERENILNNNVRIT